MNTSDLWGPTLGSPLSRLCGNYQEGANYYIRTSPVSKEKFSMPTLLGIRPPIPHSTSQTEVLGVPNDINFRISARRPKPPRHDFSGFPPASGAKVRMTHV